MILTEDDRRKFAQYLEQEIQTSHSLIDQMERMTSSVFSLASTGEKQYLAACVILHRRFQQTETQIIQGDARA